MTEPKKSFKTRTNKYKQDPFRPQPELRINPKSRRHHPIMGGEYCGRRYKKNAKGHTVLRCRMSNKKNCGKCFSFSLFMEMSKLEAKSEDVKAAKRPENK